MYPVSRLGNVSRTESSADFTSTAADDITSVMCRDVAIISSVLQSVVDSCEMLTTLSLSNLSTNSSDSSPCTPVSRYAFKPIFFDPHFLFYPSRLRHSSSLRLSLLSLLIVQSLRGSPCEKNVREVSLHFHELDHVA